MKYWLMKAEPDSRIVKGKDVKFSVDDFEEVEITPWEGVRNAEARNLMKEMAVGDHIAKEAYPDYTAWDSSHPYYDEKTDKEKPKWYMVDVRFKSRAKHFVSLALLRRIAASSEPPTDVAYIGEDGFRAVEDMALINRGRLSVQRVEETAWNAINSLADEGGWDEGSDKGRKSAKSSKTGRPVKSSKAKAQDSDAKVEAKSADDEQNSKEDAHEANPLETETKKSTDSAPKKGNRKRKATDDGEGSAAAPLRRSTRTRK
ncbi:hypothetical protein NM688_g55 [Phlebia brevispora]|uniref:Uncharacterized protein n=1 Tax=Phlebia brevispora TaxID=194682 RepID=A0ACC1TFR8_9APHY|nr:hypothetical protein NM688_g55 [Phlebia brevispora]